MHSRLCWADGCRLAIAMAFLLVSGLSWHSAQAEETTPTAEITGPRFSAADLIDVVNTLRVSNGLAPLSVHPVLMQVAQTVADGIAAGYGGHWRPNHLTLGQWLLSLGYPLSGDLSMDGYRSENWYTMDISSEVSQVTDWWQGDAVHRETMFSPDRSDIGAGLAVGEEGQLFVVVETALRTNSGQMQYDAYAILTGIPATRAAYAGMATQAAENGVPMQYTIPVAVSTPRADGAVYHDVEYGQSLWSIAIAYHTTIQQIRGLNGLSTDVVYEGQKLLVMNGATQASSPSLPSPMPPTDAVLLPVQPLETKATAQPTQVASAPDRRTTALSLGAIWGTAFFLALVLVAAFRKRPQA